MTVTANTARLSLLRQVQHWLQAARRLQLLDHLASSNAWHGIESTMADTLRNSLLASSSAVVQRGEQLAKQLEAPNSVDSLRAIKRELVRFRTAYLTAEETIHFYTVAINSRTTPTIAALLRACDILCRRSLQEILQPLGKPTPQVLTYVDKGVGASILKAGLRLWDGQVSAIAAIKVTQHNLFRPTAIIHETGHQMAHLLNWNDELATAFQSQLPRYAESVRACFSGWASEIAADAFAFVHTGYAAVASLNDVVSGAPAAVFSYHANDPHPVSYVRVLLNVEMCRQFYGEGPWNDLADAFRYEYDIDLVQYPSVPLIRACVAALPDVVRVLLKSRYRAFGNQSLSQLLPPERVSPAALERLEYIAGPALFNSHAWIWKECIRLLALTGYKIGALKGDIGALYRQQEEWMRKLGFSIELN